MTLRLASASAARRAMLEAAGIPFAVATTALDEEAEKVRLVRAGLNAAELALGLASGKALQAMVGESELVIGADQTLELDDGTLLDKPASRADAADHLRRLSGCAHRLHAAAAASRSGTILWSHVGTARLHVRTLSDGFIRDYLDAEYERVRWSVGCYHVEGRGAQLFDRIEGSHFDILGLPLLPLIAFLRRQGLLAS